MDFGNVRLLGSSAFEEIAGFVRHLGRVKVCNMGEGLRVGAGMIGLDQYVEFCDSREAAIAAQDDAQQRGVAGSREHEYVNV